MTIKKAQKLITLIKEGDPETALKAVADLRDWVQQKEAPVVKAARSHRMTWDEIGELLGRSTQGVWQKYRESA